MRFYPADARAYASGRDLLGDTMRSIDLEIQHGTYDRTVLRDAADRHAYLRRITGAALTTEGFLDAAAADDILAHQAGVAGRTRQITTIGLGGDRRGTMSVVAGDAVLTSHTRAFGGDLPGQLTTTGMLTPHPVSSANTVAGLGDAICLQGATELTGRTGDGTETARAVDLTQGPYLLHTAAPRFTVLTDPPANRAYFTVDGRLRPLLRVGDDLTFDGVTATGAIFRILAIGDAGNDVNITIDNALPGFLTALNQTTQFRVRHDGGSTGRAIVMHLLGVTWQTATSVVLKARARLHGSTVWNDVGAGITIQKAAHPDGRIAVWQHLTGRGPVALAFSWEFLPVSALTTYVMVRADYLPRAMQA